MTRGIPPTGRGPVIPPSTDQQESKGPLLRAISWVRFYIIVGLAKAGFMPRGVESAKREIANFFPADKRPQIIQELDKYKLDGLKMIKGTLQTDIARKYVLGDVQRLHLLIQDPKKTSTLIESFSLLQQLLNNKMPSKPYGEIMDYAFKSKWDVEKFKNYLEQSLKDEIANFDRATPLLDALKNEIEFARQDSLPQLNDEGFLELMSKGEEEKIFLNEDGLSLIPVNFDGGYKELATVESSKITSLKEQLQSPQAKGSITFKFLKENGLTQDISIEVSIKEDETKFSDIIYYKIGSYEIEVERPWKKTKVIGGSQQYEERKAMLDRLEKDHILQRDVLITISGYYSDYYGWT